MKVIPAVILKTKFVLPTSAKFKNYVNYIDRANTKSKANEFKLYQDYMGNVEKTTSLFTDKEDYLSNEGKEYLKEVFETAQKNGSIMWQDVISFDNQWLSEQGIYNFEHKTLDSLKIKEATRRAMDEMIKREGMEGTLVWSAAIHYNTDNIHVHVSTVQPFNPRIKGKRRQATLDVMKSKVAHCLSDRAEQNKELNKYIRDEVIAKKRVDKFKKFSNRDMYKDFKEIYQLLPEDRRQWSYNYNSLNDTRPLLDKLTDKYIEKNFKNEHKEFLKNLDREVLNYKRLYGENSKFDNYKKNKIRDLYTRMGNTILKELKEHDKELRNKGYKNKRDMLMLNITINKAYHKINRYMKNNYESMKNIKEYEYEQQQKDYEKGL